MSFKELVLDVGPLDFQPDDDSRQTTRPVIDSPDKQTTFNTNET
jgi:hypothetical protein